MKSRQKRVKLKCDNCGKETDWEVLEEDGPEVPGIAKGWIINYDVSGTSMFEHQGSDLCGRECLHEAIDKYFDINKSIWSTKVG